MRILSIAWSLYSIYRIPGMLRRIVVEWREGTELKQRNRVLRAHVAELEELNADLRRQV